MAQVLLGLREKPAPTAAPALPPPPEGSVIRTWNTKRKRTVTGSSCLHVDHPDYRRHIHPPPRVAKELTGAHAQPSVVQPSMNLSLSLGGEALGTPSSQPLLLPTRSGTPRSSLPGGSIQMPTNPTIPDAAPSDSRFTPGSQQLHQPSDSEFTVDRRQTEKGQSRGWTCSNPGGKRRESELAILCERFLMKYCRMEAPAGHSYAGTRTPVRRGAATAVRSSQRHGKYGFSYDDG